MSRTGLNVAFTTDIVDDVTNAKGVANYVRFLSRHLGKLNPDHKFSTVHFEASDEDAFQHGLNDFVIDPYPLPSNGFQKLVTNRVRGRQALADFDVIHAAAPRLYYSSR